ncbi:MAG: winged helix-turn-helix domain-containing protein, partial [Chitinophagaceae bacterium]|nr:winged helix-turn-helix domain-containing protein [Rubrivivax sp.]
VITREALSAAVQPGSYMPLDRAVDVQVARLRKKLRAAPGGADWIETVRGEGYVFTGRSA